jgi:antitoxin (DNA-binding transcriptional repressor) of toxin-antitoxin stability system
MGQRIFDVGHEARLLDLIRQSGGGDDLILTDGGEAIAKVIPITRAKATREFGSAKGLVGMAADFDAPLDDFAEYT